MEDFKRPDPIRKPGRQAPYVTLVDTALGIAIQNTLAGVSMRLRGIEDAPFPPLDEHTAQWLEFLASELAHELSDRSF